MEPVLDAEQQQFLDEKLKPYVDRLGNLKVEHEKKDLEVKILHLAITSLVHELEDAKEKMKKLNRTKYPKLFQAIADLEKELAAHSKKA